MTYNDTFLLRHLIYRYLNAAGENSSFIFKVCVKSVPLYHFKLACLVLHMVVKEFFETRFKKLRNMPF